jgi:hypothetical protein
MPASAARWVDDDHYMRIEDGGLLFDACERREEQQRAARTVNVDRLIDELTELPPRRTLKLETADEAAEDKAAEAIGR